MTDAHDEYGDILRRALHAEADTVMPAADGLDRIRRRISERPPPRFSRSWFMVSWTRPVMAGAAAIAMAAVVVSAPPAINSITSAGGHGPSDQGKRGQGGTSGAHSGGTSGEPSEASPGPDRSQQLSSTASRTMSPSPGLQTCGGHGGGESAAPNATSTPPAPSDPQHCQSTVPPTTTPPVVTTPPPADPPPPASPPQDPQPQSTTDGLPQGTP